MFCQITLWKCFWVAVASIINNLRHHDGDVSKNVTYKLSSRGCYVWKNATSFFLAVFAAFAAVVATQWIAAEYLNYEPINSASI